MKLPFMLSSRSRSNSPGPIPPASPPSSTMRTSPKIFREKLRLSKPQEDRCHSKRASEGKEIVEVLTSSGTPGPISDKGKHVMSECSPVAAVGKITERRMHEMEQVFAQFDADGDGKISPKELQAVLGSLGDEPTNGEAEQMVKELDTDGDGFVNLQEFFGMSRRSVRQAVAEEEMAAAFAVFDLDRNGWITAEELQTVLQRLSGSLGQRCSVEDCRRMIRGVDRKGAGCVDFEDFKHMVMMSPVSFC